MSDQTTLASLSATLEGVVAAARPSIVSVHSRRSRASGFVWKAGLVVTADEGLAEEGDIAISLADGTSRPATIVGRDHTTDVALLRFDGVGPAPAKLSAVVPALGSLAVDAIAHGQDEPASEICDGVCRFHARLAGAREDLDEAVLLVLRVGGPGCELPKRLELERFAISLVTIDLREGRAAGVGRVRVGAEPILEAICQANANEVPPTLRTVAVASPAEAAPASTPRPPSTSRLGAPKMPSAQILCPGKS